MQKNGSDGASNHARSRPIGAIDIAAKGRLPRPDGASVSRVFWVRTATTSLHLRRVSLQI